MGQGGPGRQHQGRVIRFAYSYHPLSERRCARRTHFRKIPIFFGRPRSVHLTSSRIRGKFFGRTRQHRKDHAAVAGRRRARIQSPAYLGAGCCGAQKILVENPTRLYEF
jgi:hypothetical protein